MDPLAQFTPATQAWFKASFPAPTAAQAEGWPAIADGDHTLIHAPTGSGKTLAAFLWTIDRLLHEPLPGLSERCRVLYVSPLKALAYDIDRNLRAPLLGIRHAAARSDYPELPELTTFLRTGDTPADHRRRMLRNPPDILITTPESLYLMLTSRASAVLATVRWVIVDEVHAVAGTKRGAHLALSLERLEDVALTPPQRIGLSATQRPLATTARFLGGGMPGPDGSWNPRPVTIVDADAASPLEVELVVPTEDMAEPAPPDPLDPGAVRVRSIWPSVYPQIHELIRAHSSTIVFTNSRRLAERLCNEINTLAGEEIARAHHGSVSREQRVQIEESLKRGDLAAVVATSSLELGIDMGAVDLVIQVEAPTSVASGLQRVGRAGHHVGGVSRAKVFPKHRADLLLATVVVDRMVSRQIEETHIPRSPVDVLAQQLVAATVIADRSVDDLYRLVRRAAPYADLGRGVFDATLDMLAGRYPSDLFAGLRPRLVWDRVEGTVSARPGARQLVVTNPGTIPDRGLFRVTLPDGTRVGELDEEMVYESRQGDVFVLGSSTWQISDIGPDRVEVIPAPTSGSARLPFWHGDALGRSVETGEALGRFLREVSSLPAGDAIESLTGRYRLDRKAATNAVRYLDEQREATGTVPSDQTLVVERFRDEIGDWRVVILSPFGGRVHAPWAMAVRERLRATRGADVDLMWTDDGIAFRFPDADEVPEVDDLIPDPEDVEDILVEHLADTALFAARFREAAGRSLLLPRRRPGDRVPLWLQRRRAADLLAVARQFGSFPIVLETYREVLQDDFDLPGLVGILTRIRSRRIRVAEVETRSASPFAASLLFAFVASFMYEGDTPLAERRAAALTLDRELLRELLGESELHDLVDHETIAALELELQRLTPDRAVAGAEGVADLLRMLGPLSINEVARRYEGDDLTAAVESLRSNRRIIPVRIAGDERLAVSEDAGRLRDAAGVQPPPGIPHVFLEPVPDPLGDVVGRYARTHGPFPARDVAHRFGLPVAAVQQTLCALEAAGRVTRTGASDEEWVDTEVLRRIKRRALAALRSEIEAVPIERLAAFVPTWHGIGATRARGRPAMEETLRRMEASALPASVLERDVLGIRHHDPASALDQLMVEGEVVWVGMGSLGPRDGKIALYVRDHLPSLHTPTTDDRPDGPHHAAILEYLDDRGASFFRELYAACGGDPAAVLDALWDLVWASLVTNDTLAPVRAYGARRPRQTGGRPRLASSYPPHAAGRWSLVSHLIDREVSPTEVNLARAELLLDRHGIVTRTGVAAEAIPGGFTGLYPVFSHLEETGRIRRGYFVDGLGGAQFALPGAVDRLRSEDDTGLVALAATDPANAYGAALPWPDLEGGRLARVPGAYVILDQGRLVAYLEGRALRTLNDDPDAVHPVSEALARLGRSHHRFRVEKVNGRPVATTPFAPALRSAGFSTTTRGLVLRP